MTVVKQAAISTDFEHAFNTSKFSPKTWITDLQAEVNNALANSSNDGAITKGLKGLGKFLANDVILDTGSQALSAAALPIRTTLGAIDYAKGDITGKEYTGRLADSASGALWTAGTLLTGGAAKVGLKGATKGLLKMLPTSARKAYKIDTLLASRFADKYKKAQKTIIEATKNNPAERAKQLKALSAQKAKEWANISSKLKDPESAYKYLNNFGDKAISEFSKKQKVMPIDSFINSYKTLKDKNMAFRKSVWNNASPEQKKALLTYYGISKPSKYLGYSFMPTIAGVGVSAAGAPKAGNALISIGDTMYDTVSYPFKSLSSYATNNMNTVKGDALDRFLAKNNISKDLKNFLFTKTKNNQYVLNHNSLNTLASKLEKASNGVISKDDAIAYIRKSFAPELNTTPGSLDKLWEQGFSHLSSHPAKSYKYTNMANNLRSFYAKDLNDYYVSSKLKS